jgi:site-specific DNA-methyltransferase (adenine-specific)
LSSYSIHFDQLVVLPDRQRKEFVAEELIELSNSISRNGLMHPPVVRKLPDGRIALVAGERRIRAMQYIWMKGQGVRCGTITYKPHEIPVTPLEKVDPVDAFEMELEENIRRSDLRWQERAESTKKLLDLQREKAAKEGRPGPSLEEFTKNVAERKIVGSTRDVIRQETILAANLHIPEVFKAKNSKEAMKVLRRHDQVERARRTAVELGDTFTSSVHTLLKGDCREHLETFADNTFDVILSDPPYGINAQDFRDGGGRMASQHAYDDSPEHFDELLCAVFPQFTRVTKPNAHLYLFCDIDWFVWLRSLAEEHGWRPFRTPLIWHNQTGSRVPWLTQGPQRRYQLIFYAVKGDKPVTQIRSDVLQHSGDENIGHSAQKPVSLIADLLARSGQPGETVLDPFCGSGPIFPVAHSLKVKATGIELDEAAYGIAAQRLQELK